MPEIQVIYYLNWHSKLKSQAFIIWTAPESIRHNFLQDHNDQDFKILTRYKDLQ